MTNEDFLSDLVAHALPDFNIVTGEGMNFQDWLISESIEKPSCFISYEGFNETEIYSNGSVSFDDENYSIFLRCDGNLKPYAKLLKARLLELESTFENEDGEQKYVSMQRGNPFRDNGGNAFEISIIIK